ncbi:MAG: hypothetical protein ACM3X6_05310, partial [Patescibacteria group bacterium]
PPSELASRVLGHGADYKYPHDFPGAYVPQQYLPDNMVGTRFYRPKGEGYERQIKERMERLGVWRKEEGEGRD